MHGKYNHVQYTKKRNQRKSRISLYRCRRDGTTHLLGTRCCIQSVCRLSHEVSPSAVQSVLDRGRAHQTSLGVPALSHIERVNK